MTTVILVPVKEHAKAKSRMSPVLTREERYALVWAMFEDLIQAIRPLPHPAAIVTNSRRAAQRVEMLGWGVIWEEGQTSESESVDAASKMLAQGGVAAVLRLPADLPLVQTADIMEVLSAQTPAPSAILVPSWDCRGTNALLRTPPDLFASHFGSNSFALHSRAAAESGAQLRIVENSRLALDLDDAFDIARFLARPADCHTYRTLMNLDIEERLICHGIQRNSHPRAGRNA